MATETNIISIFSDKNNIKRSSTKIHGLNLNMTTQNCLWIHTCNCNSIMINIFLKQLQSMHKPNLKSTQIIQQKLQSYIKETIHKLNRRRSHTKMDQFTNFTCINTSFTHIKIIIIEQTIIKLKPSFILIKKIFPKFHKENN